MIKVTGLRKTFEIQRGKIRALNGIDFEVPKGSFFTLLGPSGCGKSTMLRCVAGLETPEAGEIVIGDQVVFSSRDRIFVPPNRRGVGMVFQSYAIWPHMNVFENVAFSQKIRWRRPARSEIEERVREALRLVGLEGFEKRPATRLSGGQQQRVAVARALVQESAVLLMDEPLSNLDAKLREQMRVELAELLNRLNLTTLYVTHDQLEAFTLSKTVAVMNEGDILQTGSPAEIYSHPYGRFVADFVGSANFFKARVLRGGAPGACARVETSFGSLDCSVPRPVEEGEDVTVMARPEGIELACAKADGGAGCFRGTLERVTFLGAMCECRVSIGQEKVRVWADALSELANGAAVFVKFSPERCSVVESR